MKVDLSKHRLEDLLQFVVGVVSFVSAALGILTFRQGKATTVGFALIAVSCLSVIFFIKILNLSHVSLKRLKVLADTFKMCTKVIKKDAYYLKQQRLDRKLSQQELLSHMKTTSREYVSRIANALTVLTGEEVCVCIKVFLDGPPRVSEAPQQPEDYHVTTLCRSNNTPSERFTGAVARVGDNTDFLKIIRDKLPYFRHKDLTRYAKQLGTSGAESYRNSNPNWREHYRGRIVVPIVAEERVFESGTEGERDLLGFLCADSLSPDAFRASHAAACTHLIQAFATVLYPYFDRMYSYLNESE